MSQVRSLSAAPISHTYMSIAHLLGNGPSRKDFVNYPEGTIFGCNLSDQTLPLKATFIMDKACIGHIHNNKVKLNFPVIVPQNIRQLAEQCDPAPVILDTILNNVENGESTGHKAVEYLLAKEFTEIHMWGFDSLYLETVESDSHIKMPECASYAKNWKKWRTNWQKIFNSELGKKCKFEIHGKPL